MVSGSASFFNAHPSAECSRSAFAGDHCKLAVSLKLFNSDAAIMATSSSPRRV